MNPTIDRLKLIFLAIFALAAAGSWAYQVIWVWPKRECESKRLWWDAQTRICAAPIYIPSLTGRPEGMSRKDWAEKKAAEIIKTGE